MPWEDATRTRFDEKTGSWIIEETHESTGISVSHGVSVSIQITHLREEADHDEHC